MQKRPVRDSLHHFARRARHQHAQLILLWPDLNHYLRMAVFPAGPQPLAPDGSVPRWTSFIPLTARNAGPPEGSHEHHYPAGSQGQHGSLLRIGQGLPTTPLCIFKRLPGA